MKKILKYSIFIFILFLGFSTNVFGVSTTKKNFCEGGGGNYAYPCDYTVRRCTYTYSDNPNSSKYNIDIDNTGNAKFYAPKEDFYLLNWEKNDILKVNGKKIYEETNECPKYLFNYDFSLDFHVSNSENDSKTVAAKYGIVYVYKLDSVTINTYNSIDGSEKNEDNSNASGIESCAGFKSEEECKLGKADEKNFGCAWNKDYKFCSANGLVYLSCGSGDTIAYDIPVMLPQLTSYAITALKTVTPVILIIMGMFQLIKAITSQNEDEMKKARGSLIKKLIAAVIIFFMVSIVQFVIGKVADTSEQESLSSCLSCFLNNDCGRNFYYTDGYGNCYNVSDNQKRNCPVENY